ncbi:MAG TPA: DUF2283 domain-containing protein [Sunxiuqinia sp.]|nr:DUF2283 domain-containing protein [Sunxiuqinia sp.]
MVIKYDKDIDAIYIKLSDEQVAESDEEKPGIILDYDESGNIVGIEVLNASKKMNHPNGVTYEVA